MIFELVNRARERRWRRRHGFRCEHNIYTKWQHCGEVGSLKIRTCICCGRAQTK